MSGDTLSLQHRPISSKYQVDALTRKAIDTDANGVISHGELKAALTKDQVILSKRTIAPKPHFQESEATRTFVEEHGNLGKAFLNLFGADGAAVTDGSPLARKSAIKLSTSLPIAEARTLFQNYAEVERSIARGALVMPSPDEAQGLASALHVSNDRILGGAAEGRLTLEEARQAQHMLDSMSDTMDDIRSGRAEIKLDETVPGDRQGWTVKRPNGDAARVMVRPDRTQQGEARVKFETQSEGGTRLPKPSKLSVRIDHQKIDDKAAIDVQFGDEFYGKDGTLDKKIHGLMLEPDGTPKRSRDNKTIPDHHFGGVLPAGLNDPKQFAAFGQRFVDANKLPR